MGWNDYLYYLERKKIEEGLRNLTLKYRPVQKTTSHCHHLPRHPPLHLPHPPCHRPLRGSQCIMVNPRIGLLVVDVETPCFTIIMDGTTQMVYQIPVGTVSERLLLAPAGANSVYLRPQSYVIPAGILAELNANATRTLTSQPFQQRKEDVTS